MEIITYTLALIVGMFCGGFAVWVTLSNRMTVLENESSKHHY